MAIENIATTWRGLTNELTGQEIAMLEWDERAAIHADILLFNARDQAGGFSVPASTANGGVRADANVDWPASAPKR